MEYNELLIEIQSLLLMDDIKNAHTFFVNNSKELKPFELCKGLYLYLLYSLNNSENTNYAIQDYFELLDEMNLSNDLIMAVINMIITNIKLFIKGIESLINRFVIDEKYCDIAEKIIISEMKINDSSSLLALKINNIVTSDKGPLTEKIIYVFLNVERNWNKTCRNLFHFCWKHKYITCVLTMLKQDLNIVNEYFIDDLYKYLLNHGDKKQLKELFNLVLTNQWSLYYYDKYRQVLTEEEFKKEESQLMVYAKNAKKYNVFLIYEGLSIEKNELKKILMKDIDILFNRVSEDNKKVISDYILGVKYSELEERELIYYLKIIDRIDHQKFKKIIDLILCDKDRKGIKSRYIKLFIDSMIAHKDDSYCGFYLYQE